MQIPVLIEPVAGNGFRARGCEPLDVSAEGTTEEAALRKLREQIDRRLAAGARLVLLEIPAPANPWVEFAGMSRADPLFDEWQQAIAENRRRADADPDVS
jgi:predicted RNase H-like HicB family nuclease